jgi:hypothetical protein
MLKPRIYWVGKEGGRRSEDAFAWSGAVGRFALSDGASTSYAGRAWARALCWQFMRDPDFGADWLSAARIRFRDTVVISEDEDWSASMAFERGSFATFLGFTVLPDRIQGYAIGDTVLFIFDEEGRVHWLPPLSPEEFGEDPILLSTHASLPTEAKGGAPSTEFDFPQRALKAIAATDALAAWTVGDGDENGILGRLNFLADLKSNSEFRDFVHDARAKRSLKIDDCTLMIVEQP